jgi:HEAT repeat protein
MSKALRDADVNVRATAISGLASRGAKDQADAVLALAKDPQDRVRAAVASAVGDFARDKDLGALETLVHDPSYSVRLASIESAGRFGNDRALAILDVGLADPDPSVRRQAVRSLGQVASPGALARLRRVAGAGEVELRVAAIDQLRERKDRGSKDVLQKASQDPVERVRDASRKALQAIGG